jgi:hypothetical protein
LPIFRGIRQGDFIAKKFRLKNAFLWLKKHSAAITLQSHMKKYLSRKHYVQKLKLKAQAKLYTISKKNKIKSIVRFLKLFKSCYLMKVRLIQKVMKGYLKLKR